MTIFGIKMQLRLNALIRVEPSSDRISVLIRRGTTELVISLPGEAIARRQSSAVQGESSHQTSILLAP